MNFNFPAKTGTGISKLLPHDHVSQECIELIELMCTYDPDERYFDFTSCIVNCTTFYSIVNIHGSQEGQWGFFGVGGFKISSFGNFWMTFS